MNNRKGGRNGSKIGREEWEEGRKVGIEERRKGGIGIVAKALHGQRYPMPLS